VRESRIEIVDTCDRSLNDGARKRYGFARKIVPKISSCGKREK